MNYNNKQNNKTNEAKLTAFMQKKWLQNATILTSKAITEATTHINMSNLMTTLHQHKIQQLEKTIQQQQEQSHHLNNKIHDIERKNYQGSWAVPSTKPINIQPGHSPIVTWAPTPTHINNKRHIPTSQQLLTTQTKQIKWIPPQNTINNPYKHHPQTYSTNTNQNGNTHQKCPTRRKEIHAKRRLQKQHEITTSSTQP